MPKSMFKKKLFGYSPAEVSSYITKMNSQAAIEIESVERNTASLRSVITKLNNEIEGKNVEIAELSALRDELEKVKSDRDTLEQEVSTLKEKLLESEDRCVNIKAEYDALDVRLKSVTEQAESYTKTCAEAGNILIIAKDKADEMCENAKKNAEVIIRNAKITADEIIGKSSSEAKAYYAKTKLEADTYATKTVSDAEEQLERNKEKVEYLIKRQKQLLVALQAQKSEISKFYEETVSGLGSALAGTSKQ